MRDTIGAIFALSLGMTPVLAVMLGASPCLRRRYTARLCSLLWLMIAVRLLLPVRVDLPHMVRLSVPMQTGQAGGEETETTRSSAQTGLPSAMEAEPETPGTVLREEDVAFQESRDTQHAVGAEPSVRRGYPSPIQLASALWVAGAGVFLLYHFAAYRYTSRQLRRWAADPPHGAAEIFGRLCGELGIRGRVVLKVSPATCSPVRIGYFRPCVYLPSRLFQDEELEMILRHELTHHRSLDVWYKLVLLLSCAVHWFHPLVHWMARQAELDLELACDCAVLGDADQAARRSYGQAILESMARPGRLRLTTRFWGGKKQMLHRFCEIMNTDPKRRGYCLFSLAALLVGIGGGLVACDANTRTTQTVESGAGSSALYRAQEDAGQPAESVSGSGQVDDVPENPYNGFFSTGRQGLPARMMAVGGALDLRFHTLLRDLLLAEDLQAGRADLESRIGGAMLAGGPAPEDTTGIWPLDNRDAYGPLLQGYYRYWHDPALPGAILLAERKARGDSKAVLAHLDGRVAAVHSGDSGAFGNYVVLEHGGGTITLYALCNEILVQEGDRVSQGDAIALAGELISRGEDKFYHHVSSIYFEKWVGGQVSDSLEYFDEAYSGVFSGGGTKEFLPEREEGKFYSLLFADPGPMPLDQIGFIWPAASGSALFVEEQPGIGMGVNIAHGLESRAIYASASERVVQVVNGYTGYGHYIILDHGNGYETLYAHNKMNSVSVGEYVHQGQVIGTIGRTGNATGNYIHFEIRYEGKNLNPLDYIGYAVY